MKDYDIFISHASEDKLEVARPIAERLSQEGFRVWFDEFELRIGDSLRRSIDKGLKKSRFGLIIFSKCFLNKKGWTDYELDSLISLFSHQEGRLLPIWHEINYQDILNFSPFFADKIALSTSSSSLDEICKELKNKIGFDSYSISNTSKELIKNKNKSSLEAHDFERGFQKVLSRHTDKIIDFKITNIKTEHLINPFSKDFNEFKFHHWQDRTGKIELIRVQVISYVTGTPIKHSKDVRVDSNNLEVSISLSIKKIEPIFFIFEFKTTNYYPNLFVEGFGYTDFFINTPISYFEYQLILPNALEYKDIDCDCNNIPLKKCINSTELCFKYEKFDITKNNELKFKIRNKNIK